MIQRRKLMGAVMVLAAVVLLVVAMVSRFRWAMYAAYVLVAVGLWMMTRRAD